MQNIFLCLKSFIEHSFTLSLSRSALEKNIYKVENSENTYGIWEFGFFTYIHDLVSIILAWYLPENRDRVKSLYENKFLGELIPRNRRRKGEEKERVPIQAVIDLATSVASRAYAIGDPPQSPVRCASQSSMEDMEEENICRHSSPIGLGFPIITSNSHLLPGLYKEIHLRNRAR